MEKLILMDPHEKWTHKVDSVVHWRPRLDAAQSPMFYSTVCFSRESKGQSQAGFYSSHDLISFFIMPPPLCLAFCFPPAFLPSRAISKFNQANILIVCRVPILSSPIKSFLRRNSTSAAIDTSVNPKIRKSENPKKMAMKASATIISASDLDSDGEDGPLVSLMGKLSVERKAKAQNVEYTRDLIVVDQSSVGISCNLGPGNLEAARSKVAGDADRGLVDDDVVADVFDVLRLRLPLDRQLPHEADERAVLPIGVEV